MISIRGKEYQEAMKKLGAIYGVKDMNSFVSILLETATSEDDITSSQLQQANENITDSLKELADAIISMNGQAIFIEELSSAFEEYCKGSDELSEKLKEPPNDDTKAIVSITPSKSLGAETGYLRAVTIPDIMPSYNPVDTNDSSRRTIGVVEMHHPNLNYSNRDSLAASVFLQALPSIEISKAVPFFDVKVITKMSAVAPENNVEANPLMFTNGISIYKFLHGQNEISEQSTVYNMATATPLEPAGEDNFTPGTTVAGMELFTSPQTMVDGTLEYQDLDASNNNFGENANPGRPTRANAVQDKFRPLMTVESMSVNVVPSVGFLSSKSAELKLILHDKTRMSDISPLIVPGSLGDIELLIEYGWSHPQTKASENPYGALINSMRVKEKFGIMNSSYTFDPSGQVQITLKLYTKGADKATFDLVTQYENKKHPADVIKEVISAVRENMKSLKQIGYEMSTEMGAPDSLGKAKNLGGILSLTGKDYTAINDFIKAMKNRSNAESASYWDKLATSVGTLQGEIVNFQNHIETVFGEKLDACTDDSVKEHSDPYIIPMEKTIGKTKILDIDQDKYVSLGKALLYFVADPLIQSGQFNEVQLIFYPINEHAMFASGLSLASYPLNKDTFGTIFKAELEKSPSLTLQRFLNLIKKVFVNYVGDDIYGLKSYYDREDGKAKVKELYTKNDTNKQIMAQAKINAMRAAYGDNGIKTFKKPKITMHIECVNHKDDISKTIVRLHIFDQAATSYGSYASLWQSTSSAELGIIGKYQSAKSSYEKIVSKKDRYKKNKDYDNWEKLELSRKNRFTNYKKSAEAAFAEFTRNKLIEPFQVKTQVQNPDTNEFEEKEITKYRIVGGPQQMRGMMAANMPTLKYGTEYSGILQASLQTNSNPQMETIMMQRQGKGNAPKGTTDDGLPLQIKPVTLTLDTFGCPYIMFGQQFFVDFQTNTSIDDVYSVTGISHTISPGEYKTNIKLVPLNKFGQFRSFQDSLDNTLALSADVAKNIKK